MYANEWKSDLFEISIFTFQFFFMYANEISMLKIKIYVQKLKYYVKPAQLISHVKIDACHDVWEEMMCIKIK